MILAIAAFLTSVSADRPQHWYVCDRANRTQVSIAEADTAYKEKSVAMVRSASNGDLASLEGAVATDATFTLYIGDVGTGPRALGAAAFIAFTKDLKAQRFAFNEVADGLISVDPCGDQAVEVDFFGEDVMHGYRLTFTYSNAMLKKVEGGPLNLRTGQVNGALHG